MKVIVITRWYQEEFFAPFFLNHYRWADEIIVLLEKSNTDRSLEIISRYSNAKLIYCYTGELLNDRKMSDMQSDLTAKLDADWVIRADADEYVFPYGFKDPREVLGQAGS